MELLKRALHADYADHRLCASMIGNLAVYTALTRPGDTIMSAPQPMGGHSSDRPDGPAGVRGLGSSTSHSPPSWRWTSTPSGRWRSGSDPSWWPWACR